MDPTTTTPRPTITLSKRQIDHWRNVPDPTARRLRLSGPTAAFALPRTPRSVPVIRQLSRMWMDFQPITDDGARYAVQLVVSELTANAVEHTNSKIIISRLHRDLTEVVVEVRDEGGTLSLPQLTPSGHVLDHGRGLELVAEAACGWGLRLDPADHSCTVWAMIPYPEAPTEATRAA